ncbi:MAG: superoxide dismutase [Alphaproteobacteria bacterium]|nr:superoxide dismutase [Alphaproteobacteria bacterium]
MFEMIALPYNMNDLEPYVSQQTFEYHYGKHYKNYVDTLNKLIAGTEFENMTLEEIIKAVYGKPEYQAIFNNAGQVFNHQFFWHSMKPNGGGKPNAKLLKQIEEQFGSYEDFAKEFKNTAISQFGSGWAWLVSDDRGLKIIKTANADTPIAHGQIPIIGIDVWEHAYYLDYQNRRSDFIDVFLNNLVNWPQI